MPCRVAGSRHNRDGQGDQPGPQGHGHDQGAKKHSRRLHHTVAFTPERLCLGIVEAQWWSRDTPSPREERRNKGIAENESQRWVGSYQASCAAQGQLPDTLVVNLADAEGDLYDWYVDHQEFSPDTQAQWIVRASQNRRLVEPAQSKLWSALDQALTLGVLDVEVKARPQRPARRANVTLRTATVKLRAPDRTGHKLPCVPINAVLTREENPPRGIEPVEWLLLTSLPVTTLEQASTVVEWYGVRWCVEPECRIENWLNGWSETSKKCWLIPSCKSASRLP